MAEEAQEIPKENDTDVQDTQESPKADVEAEKEAGQVPVAEITNQNQIDETDGPKEKEDGKGGEDETDNTAPEFAAQGDGGEDEPNDPKEEPVKDSDKEAEDQTIPKTVAEGEETEGTSQVAAAQGQAAEENPSEDVKPEDEEKAEPTDEQGMASHKYKSVLLCAKVINTTQEAVFAIMDAIQRVLDIKLEIKGAPSFKYYGSKPQVP